MGTGAGFDGLWQQFSLLDAKSLAACHLFESITSLLTRRRVNSATTSTVGNATIQLLNHPVIHRFKNPSTHPVVFKTETTETTQDIKIDRKKPTVSWEYLAGIIFIEPCTAPFSIQIRIVSSCLLNKMLHMFVRQLFFNLKNWFDCSTQTKTFFCAWPSNNCSP